MAVKEKNSPITVNPADKKYSGSSLQASPNDLDSTSSSLEQLTHSITHISGMLDKLSEPLIHYLHVQNETFSDTTLHATSKPLEVILSESPIAALLDDQSVSDILINGPYEIYINRADKLEKTDLKFADSRSLRKLANTIAASVGRTIDPKRPLVDARLQDGSRVNIIAPPMAVGGLSISIRKFPLQEITLDSLVEKEEMTSQIAEFLKLCAQSRVSLLISGGTGTGKTTLLNAISHFIPESERIVTIEDTAELRLQQPHVVRLETKEPDRIGERSEEVNASDLVRNALRMRPDRIIVGEVRGEEAYDMIQALNTGHNGSLTTVHANTSRDALTRLENLISTRMQNTQAENIRSQIVSALNFIVQIVYDQNGKRRIASVTEIVGMEKDVTTTQDIFILKEDAVSDPSRMQYRQFWTGIIPRHPRLSEAMRASPAFKDNLNTLANNMP